jgi:hypothetical protein
VINLAVMGMACKPKAPEKPAAKEEMKPAEAPAPPAPAAPAATPAPAAPAATPKK